MNTDETLPQPQQNVEQTITPGFSEEDIRRFRSMTPEEVAAQPPETRKKILEIAVDEIRREMILEKQAKELKSRLKKLRKEGIVLDTQGHLTRRSNPGSFSPNGKIPGLASKKVKERKSR